MTTTTPKQIHEAIYELSLAKPVPDAALLDQFTRAYPQFATELTEFAIELAIDALRFDEDEPDIPEHPETVSPIVSRVMSRIQNELFHVRESGAGSANSQAARSPSENPFTTLDRGRFRSVAADAGVNTVFLSKLRDRLIDPETIPQSFCDELSQHMAVPVELLTAHFRAPAALATAQFFKAEGKPATGQQQSFVDAVRQSGLSEDQQERLMSFVR